MTTTKDETFTLEQVAESDLASEILNGSDALASFEKLKALQGEQPMTPLQKSYNSLVEDGARLTQAILIQMENLITRNLAPTFDNLERTATGMVIVANLTPENLQKYQTRWADLEKQLMNEDGE